MAGSDSPTRRGPVGPTSRPPDLTAVVESFPRTAAAAGSGPRRTARPATAATPPGRDDGRATGPRPSPPPRGRGRRSGLYRRPIAAGRNRNPRTAAPDPTEAATRGGGPSEAVTSL